MDMKLREQFIDEDSGVFAISLVSDPAIEKDFIMLSKEVKLSINKEKRLVTGAILVPDLPIMRLTKDKEPYHIFFSKETVEKASQKYLTDHNQESVTLEHKVDVNDVVLVESWIKVDDNHDKTTALGVEAPNGSWVGSFKVNNDTVWNDIIKTGIVKGFSIEGLFKQTEVEQSKTIIMEDKSIIDKIKTLLSGEEKPKEVVVEMATQEEVTNLCKQVETLEETIKGLVTKIEEMSKVELETEPVPPTTPSKGNRSGGRNPQSGEVVIPEEEQEEAQTAATDIEVVEEPVEKEKVEMIAVTDAVNETKLKSVKFDPYMTAQERIRQALIK